jgi:DNA replication and repair protein RecF
LKLLKLQIENFRSYETLVYQFNGEKSVMVLQGPNGMGKTNFLEAIYLLAIGKSFRTSSFDHLLQYEKQHFRCILTVEDADGEVSTLEVAFSQKPKREKLFKINDVKQKTIDYLGFLPVVLFHPEDLNILYQTPSKRRSYLNLLLSQVDKEYLLNLSYYHRSLKHRNALLKEIRSRRVDNNVDSLLKDLDVWDEKIASYGQKIVDKRKKFVDFLSRHITKTYVDIAGKNQLIEIAYKTNISPSYRQKMEERREVDIIQAKTTIGPHRDDLEFYLNSHEIKASASRGEFRSLLLALKILEIKYIEENLDKKPILLLDDVFSELDPQRQEHLLDTAANYQTLITTAEQKKYDGDICCLNVKNML